MTFLPSSSKGNFTGENISIPEDQNKLLPFLKTVLEEHARFINRKDTGQYENIELQVNQTFPAATPQTKHHVYRKIIDTGALPNAALSTVAHNIAGIGTTWFFTRIYGTAWDPVAFEAIPIPNPGPTRPLEILVNNTNILLQTTVNLGAFTQSSVTLEYYKA